MSHLQIEVAGSQKLLIQLPFAVSTADSSASLELLADEDHAVLRITLPYCPYDALVEDARAKAPHSFGELKLSNAAFMDLD
jgi:hypothetical protein